MGRRENSPINKPVQEVNVKCCSTCHETKPLTDFSAQAKGRFGVTSICKVCASEYHRKRYIEKKDEIDAHQKKYVEENKESVLARQRARYAKHVDAERARSRAYRDKNTERERARSTSDRTKSMRRSRYSQNPRKILDRTKIFRDNNIEWFREYNRKYQKENLDLFRFYRGKRRAFLLQATPSWVDWDAVKAIYKQAHDMSIRTGIAYQVDHTIPLNSKLVCGLHCEANLQILTKRKNQEKGNRFWPDMP